MMKRLLLSQILLLSLCSLFSQRTEFPIYSNGLIYHDTTVQQLNVLVDSLNLVYKTCDLARDYYANAQTSAHQFSIEGDAELVRRNLEKGISFADLKRQYPGIKVRENLLIYQRPSETEAGDPAWEFSEMPINYGYGYGLVWPQNKPCPGAGGYLFEQLEGKTIGLYLLQDLTQSKLIEKYARMVQYVDCMVDTNASILLNDRWEEAMDDSPEEMKAFSAFLALIKDFPGKPELPFGEEYYRWDSLRQEHIVNELSHTNKFKILLKQAVEEAEALKISTEELEYYVAQFYSKAKALEFKRSRTVVGFCSQDSRPREHAMQIALLAGESGKWDIFLRAHLNIMNDRFARAIDGSYAWGERATYLKELEVLGIDVPKLLIGSCLSIENYSQGHYWGNVRRIGRALTEAENREAVELMMLDMIKDDQLDTYNRLLMVYVYRNFIHNLPEENKQEQWNKLAGAAQSLPQYIAAKIEFGK